MLWAAGVLFARCRKLSDRTLSFPRSGTPHRPATLLKDLLMHRKAIRARLVMLLFLMNVGVWAGCSNAAPADSNAPQPFTNHLANERSPYLLQHAHNPVDWYPWGAEAMEQARKENKPIFLSIGYSTCHWCHVMERESFENPEVAKLINENFVAIKVDREERPDLDAVYMQFV